MRAIRDSGVEWIGEIPAEWKISKISRCYFITLGKMLAPEQQQEDETLENYLCAANVKWEGINTDTQKQMWFNDLEKQQYRLSNGDLLIMEGGMAGTSCIYRGELEPCYFQNSILRCRAKKGFINQFLYYWLFFVYNMKYVENICNRATILHYTKEKVSATPIAFPPIPEQTAIASYLDKKCSNIDAIITKNEQIIEKLKEYKSSLITETVTKGLNPDVEMKDSGVEWIGEIPAEWKIVKVKYTGYFENGLTYSPNDITDETGILVLRSSNIQSGNLDFNDCIYVFSAPEDLMVKRGDIIICSRNGSVNLVGKSVYIDNDIVATFGAFMMRYRTKIFDKFAFYMLQHVISYYKSFFATSTINQLTIKNIRQMVVALPSKSEQTAIANYLDEKCSIIDANIKKREIIIEKLAEYKKSLIYEVVTGKKEII